MPDGQVKLTDSTHQLRGVEVIRHRQNAVPVDVASGLQEGHSVFEIELVVVHEAQTQDEARLREQESLDLLAAITGNDHGLANALHLQAAEDTYEKRYAGNGLDRLGIDLVGDEA
jgi:hypothetical protein